MKCKLIKELKDITVIIRSVNERTEQLCKKLLVDQGVLEENLHLIREVPFSAAMRKSFQIGIENKKRWTLCVDADVLSRSGAVQKLVEHAETKKENICEVQGYMLDKFFGGIRRGGFHLYRTSLLPKVIECIPKEGVDIRPESRTLKEMAKRGYPRAVVPYIVGIHDDEQYNYDIYRKAFVQAVKHLNKADLLVSHWKENADKDPDFKVALVAFSDSIRNTEPVFIDTEQNLYKEKFKRAGFNEKEELNIDTVSLQDIEEKINTWNASEKYYDYYPDRDGLDNQKTIAVRKIRQSFKSRGVGKTALLILSQGFTGLGKKLGSRIPE